MYNIVSSEINMIQKKTIRKEIFLSGIGIHSGKNIDLHLNPCMLGEIIFVRRDLGNFELHLDPKKIEPENSSTLVWKNIKIQTIEHLMAALYASGINSLRIELNGEEIPIMDGSASIFVDAIFEAGVKPLPEKEKAIRVLKPFDIKEKGARISVCPDSDFRIYYFISFDHPIIKNQEMTFTVKPDDFAREIAPARTFGFLKDESVLREKGLARGASFENTIVLGERDILNGPLRFPDEFVRHKILDFIGDISLLGHPVIGNFKVYKSGHKMHLKVIHFIMDNPEYWIYE